MRPGSTVRRCFPYPFVKSQVDEVKGSSPGAPHPGRGSQPHTLVGALTNSFPKRRTRRVFDHSRATRDLRRHPQAIPGHLRGIRRSFADRTTARATSHRTSQRLPSKLPRWEVAWEACWEVFHRAPQNSGARAELRKLEPGRPHRQISEGHTAGKSPPGRSRQALPTAGQPIPDRSRQALPTRQLLPGRPYRRAGPTRRPSRRRTRSRPRGPPRSPRRAGRPSRRRRRPRRRCPRRRQSA